MPSFARHSFDDVIFAHGVPPFLKIDTEGHERSVLRGLSTPVSHLCFEVTPECIEAGIECVDIAAGLGRYQFNFSSWMEMPGSRLAGRFINEIVPLALRERQSRYWRRLCAPSL
jgi:hypothetical protein